MLRRFWTSSPAWETSFQKVGNRRMQPRRTQFETLEARQLLAGDTLVISELMAANESTLADEDGDFSDWIELRNISDAPVSFEGWFLTDDADDLDKWELPAQSIGADQYLLVFASGKDRTGRAGSELHTNFQLSAGGEFLALVGPDGTTIESQFSPEFPQQLQDISYGISDVASLESNLIFGGDGAEVLVATSEPTSDWTSPDFVADDSWTRGSTGVGYVSEAANSVSILFVGADASATAGADADVLAHLNAEYGAGNVIYKQATAAVAEDGTSGQFDVIVLSSTPAAGDIRDKWEDATAGVVNWDDALFRGGTGNFQFISRTIAVRSQTQIDITDSSHPVTAGLGTGVVTISNSPIRIFMGTGSTGAGVVSLAHASGNDGLPGLLVADVGDALLGNGDEGKPGVATGRRVMFPLSDDAFSQLNFTGLTLFDNAVRWASGKSADDDISYLINTDVASQMEGVATSTLVRIPFVGDIAGERESMTLQMKYDAGFVAYLNGTEIARRNAPGVQDAPVPFDAVATNERTLPATRQFEAIDVTAYIDLLRDNEQTNVLAIHGLNSAADDVDFLILPELVVGTTVNGAQQYYTTPTPGEANIEGALGTVKDTTFSVDRGFYTEPFELEITSGTPGAEIRYTLDGSAPSSTSGLLYTRPITIGGTTTLRAAAYRPGYISTNVDTQTYLFIADVLQQPDAPAGYPALFAPSWPADYGMDQDVINDPLYAGQFEDAFKALPTLSLVTERDELFGADGVYVNANRTREAPISVELILPDGTSQGFQLDAGIRAQGGASRNAEASPKHALSLRFRDIYGAGKLDYPLFEGTKIDSFDSIQLRARYNNSWIHRTSGQRDNALLVRDQWARDTMFAMGNESAGQGQPMHLYLNGLYWGIYVVQERNVAAHYAAYNGGSEDDYDGINGGRATDGTITAWNEMKATVAGGNWEEIQKVLNVDNYIDFIIMQRYSGNLDLKTNGNWRAAGGGPGRAPFEFYSWDTERTFESVSQSGNTPVNDPAGIEAGLNGIAEYRLRFADRVQMHFFNGGALMPEAAAARFQEQVDELYLPIIAESARWGDYRRPNDPYTRDDEWVRERDSVLNTYFPGRSDVVLNQFRNSGFYPAIDAAIFEVDGQPQYGGALSPGEVLSLEVPRGRGIEAYYTLDGSDPRLEGGSVNPNAIQYDGTSIPLVEGSLIRVRVQQARNWSALNEARFFVEAPASAENIVAGEIHYNPADPTQAEFEAGFTDADMFEFLELRNVSGETVDLAGAQFSEGLTFTFSPSSTKVLVPGEHAVIVSNLDAFQMRYGTDILVAGVYEGGLSNGGEQLRLDDLAGDPIFDFEYNDSGAWPGQADGRGSSLQLDDPTMASPLYNDPGVWHASSEFGGSPGSDGMGDVTDIVINEVLTHTDLPLTDAIELFNTSGADVDVSGWLLSDSSENFDKFRIPAGTVIPAGGFLFFDESDFNPSGGIDPLPNEFALSGAHGDDVWLMAVDATGKITRFADHVEFGAARNGESFGRWRDGSDILAPMLTRTLGTLNSQPRVGPLIISELMYNPDQLDSGDFEFVEIHNPTAQTVSLTNWEIGKGIDFNFDDGSSIGAGEVLVVLRFNPDNPDNAARVAAFRDYYGIDESVTLVGGYKGRLDNGGERVQLQRPDSPPADEPDFIPSLIEDEITYDDVTPWPDADGTGKSLTRTAIDAYGNRPGSWAAQTPTPGSVAFAGFSLPLVDRVSVAGTTWSDEFVSALDPSLAEINNDFTLPWSSIDQVRVTFRADASAVRQGDLMLDGVLGGNYMDQVIDFTYDAPSLTAVWTLGESFGLDGVLMQVVGAGYINSFGVLPGDGSRDSVVDARDIQALRQAMLSVPGDAEYDPAFDFNGSGSIDIRDLQPLRENLLAEVPSVVEPDFQPRFAMLAGEPAELNHVQDAAQRRSESRDVVFSLLADDSSTGARDADEAPADWNESVDGVIDGISLWNN